MTDDPLEYEIMKQEDVSKIYRCLSIKFQNFSYLEIDIPNQYIKSITSIHYIVTLTIPLSPGTLSQNFCKTLIQHIDLYLGLDKGFKEGWDLHVLFDIRIMMGSVDVAWNKKEDATKISHKISKLPKI